MKRKKINKIKRSALSKRLDKLTKVKVIDETYIVEFGQLKGMKIRSAICCDWQYIDWCIQEKLFKLNESLQAHFDKVVDIRTYTKEDEQIEKLFPWD